MRSSPGSRSTSAANAAGKAGFGQRRGPGRERGRRSGAGPARTRMNAGRPHGSARTWRASFKTPAWGRPGRWRTTFTPLRNSNCTAGWTKCRGSGLAEVVARLALRLREYRNPSWIVSRLVPLLRAICRRSAYLALIGENPGALTRLLALAERSEFLVTLVEQHPLLLDELLDERIFDAAPTREELEEALERAVRLRVTDDVEAQLEVMRTFQRGAVFRIAVADRMAKPAADEGQRSTHRHRRIDPGVCAGHGVLGTGRASWRADVRHRGIAAPGRLRDRRLRQARRHRDGVTAPIST